METIPLHPITVGIPVWRSSVLICFFRTQQFTGIRGAWPHTCHGATEFVLHTQARRQGWIIKPSLRTATRPLANAALSWEGRLACPDHVMWSNAQCPSCSMF
eukprot:3444692-Amphidinium_carterae.3